ncbi:hypothetical protein BGW38_008977, partial [Lunasporangiospora selenospora]
DKQKADDLDSLLERLQIQGSEQEDAQQQPAQQQPAQPQQHVQQSAQQPAQQQRARTQGLEQLGEILEKLQIQQQEGPPSPSAPIWVWYRPYFPPEIKPEDLWIHEAPTE